MSWRWAVSTSAWRRCPRLRSPFATAPASPAPTLTTTRPTAPCSTSKSWPPASELAATAVVPLPFSFKDKTAAVLYRHLPTHVYLCFIYLCVLKQISGLLHIQITLLPSASSFLEAVTVFKKAEELTSSVSECLQRSWRRTCICLSHVVRHKENKPKTSMLSAVRMCWKVSLTQMKKRKVLISVYAVLWSLFQSSSKVNKF